MKSLIIISLVLVNCIFAYSNSEDYPEGRSPYYEGAYQDDISFDSRPDPDELGEYPYMGLMQMLRKRSGPRWHHAFVYRNPTYRTMPIAQSKRFLPFHPLARFRGLSMGGAGGGLVGVGTPFRHDGYETYVSDSSVPSPGHPVPSGETKLADISGEDSGSENNEKVFGEEPEIQSSKDKINAGELLQYLNNVSSGRGLGKAKIFRFGIK